VYQKYLERVDQFPWNEEEEGDSLPILPLLHSTDSEIAAKICETGTPATLFFLLQNLGIHGS
jgi:hypothetical protein